MFCSSKLSGSMLKLESRGCCGSGLENKRQTIEAIARSIACPFCMEETRISIWEVLSYIIKVIVVCSTLECDVIYDTFPSGIV